MCDAEAERGKCGLGGTGWSGKTDLSLAKFAVTYGVTNLTVTNWILAGVAILGAICIGIDGSEAPHLGPNLPRDQHQYPWFSRDRWTL